MLLNNGISILYFLRQIKHDVLAIMLYSIFAGILDNYGLFKSISIPLAVSAMVGTLVSLLLAFKTSQSYERWWEARIVWGGIVNDSRTLIRQLVQFLPETPEKKAIVQRFAERQAIWCYSLGESLRRLPFSPKVQQYLDQHNLTAANVPNMLLQLHAQDLAQVSEQQQLNPNKQVQIDATLTKFTDHMGRCERIKNTVFPRSYSLLIHFLIYVFLTIFPFGLDDFFVLTEVSLTIMIPVLFIAIEKTAIILQDPFENQPTDTPMTTLAQTIERNLLEMTGQPAPPPAPANGKYYQM